MGLIDQILHQIFVEDHSYTGSGNLDKHNGRYCKTPEFPNGTYAYFAGVKNDGTSGFIPEYPYFIGDTFKSNLIKENVYLDHEFDFNSSLLVRNTLPYNVNLPTIEYDFLNESYETFEQPSVIEAITKGSVPDIQIIDGGKGYKINDAVNFDFEGSNGFGLRGQVTELTGAVFLRLQHHLKNIQILLLYGIMKVRYRHIIVMVVIT